MLTKKQLLERIQALENFLGLAYVLYDNAHYWDSRGYYLYEEYSRLKKIDEKVLGKEKKNRLR